MKITFWNSHVRETQKRFRLMLSSMFADDGSFDFEKVYSFGKPYPSASFFSCIIYCTFLLFDPQNGTQVDLPPTVIYALHICIWLYLDFLKLLKLAMHKLTQT